LPEIDFVSESLEDNVLIAYQGRQVPAIAKGVSDNFVDLTGIKSLLRDGEPTLKDEVNHFALLGLGLANSLSVNAGFVYPIEICVPKRNAAVDLVNISNSLTRDYVYIGGVFRVNQAVYDENYLIVPIDLTRKLLDYETEISALEIKLKEDCNPKQAQNKIQKILGDDYHVKDRYQQQEDTFKMVSMEKWVSFLMLCFILLIAVFNIIGSLSMLIIEKQADVATLRNMGANSRLISRIFLFEGWMISLLGAGIGIVTGILLCLGQQHFGWLKLGTGDNFSVKAYPVILSSGDLFFILLSVLAIGFLAVLYPVGYLSKKWLN
jgi:ABC-type lipoprotein release transport system permease subunit